MKKNNLVNLQILQASTAFIRLLLKTKKFELSFYLIFIKIWKNQHFHSPETGRAMGKTYTQFWQKWQGKVKYSILIQSANIFKYNVKELVIYAEVPETEIQPVEAKVSPGAKNQIQLISGFWGIQPAQMQKPVICNCQIEDDKFELQQYLKMIGNSVLLLLFTALLFCPTLGLEKVVYPPPKITTVTTPTKTSEKFSLQSELNKIVFALSTGNISSIATTLTTVTNNNNIACQDKAAYVAKATQLLKKRLTSNEQQLKILQTQPLVSAAASKNTQELKNMLVNLKNSLLKRNFDSELQAQETERKQILQNLTKFTNISNEYLNKLKEYKKKNNIQSNTTNQDKAILKLQSELQVLDQLINQTSRKRTDLHKNLTVIKVNLLNQQIKVREGISLQKLEADYRSYSELALQASIKAKNKEQQLNRLTMLLKNKQLTRTAVDDQIDKATKILQEKRGSNQEKATQLMSSANTVLNQNLKNVQSKINSLNSDCFL